jgi:hypothetical protein
MFARQAPADLEVVGVPLRSMQTAHPEEAAVGLSFDREQPESLTLVTLLRPRGDVVGISPSQRESAEVAHDLGVGVECRVQREVVRSVGPQYQSRRSQYDDAAPLDVRSGWGRRDQPAAGWWAVIGRCRRRS